MLFSILISCSGRRISEEAFSSKTWKNDKNGCNNDRLALLKDFETVKHQLIGMSENETRKILGTPDKVQLFERSQKYYIYFIESGSQCENGENIGNKEGRSYHIRFNSINQVNEVSLALPSS